MDEKKMLNGMELHDEELDKVVGGAVYLKRDGRVEISDSGECSCHNMLFFKDRMSGDNGLHTLARCQDCVYFTYNTNPDFDGCCTNPDVAASLAK